MNVVPTEAGHMLLIDSLPLDPGLIAKLRAQGAGTAETLISGPGLLRIYAALRAMHGGGRDHPSLADLLSPGLQRADPLMQKTLDVFATCFWYFAGNVVLAYGAWDGLIVTGSIAAQTKAHLQRADLRRHFAIRGPYSRRLAEVPSATASFRYAELEGAAVALLVDEAHRAFRQPTQICTSIDERPTSSRPVATAPAARPALLPAWTGGPNSIGTRRPACA
jgi:glucokinase